MNPEKMTSFLGYDVDEQTRTMLVDLCVACVVIFFIMLPNFCFQVDGPTLKRKSSDDDIMNELKEEIK
jgi:hypothetical protein